MLFRELRSLILGWGGGGGGGGRSSTVYAKHVHRSCHIPPSPQPCEVGMSDSHFTDEAN